MPTPIRYLGNPVLSLQTMLRTISFQHPVIPRIIPDGIFGEHTLEAVMIFQREFAPPVTGRVDIATWNAIVAAYQSALAQLSHPVSCTGYPSRYFTITPGDDNVHIFLIQSMFKGLSTILDGVVDSPIDGSHAGLSIDNVRWLQRLENRPETGVMEKADWDTLSRLYTIFVTYAQSPWFTWPKLFEESCPH